MQVSFEGNENYYSLEKTIQMTISKLQVELDLQESQVEFTGQEIKPVLEGLDKILDGDDISISLKSTPAKILQTGKYDLSILVEGQDRDNDDLDALLFELIQVLAYGNTRVSEDGGAKGHQLYLGYVGDYPILYRGDAGTYICVDKGQVQGRGELGPFGNPFKKRLNEHGYYDQDDHYNQSGGSFARGHGPAGLCGEDPIAY